MSGVDGFDGVERDCGVVGDGEVSETLCIAELSGDDVLEELSDGLCACDIAGLIEEIGVIGEKLPPTCGGLFVPGEDVFVR